MIRILYFVITLALYASSVVGQDAELVRAKQRLLFNDPGVLQIRLERISSKRSSPIAGPPETLEPFRTGDRVRIGIMITNNSQSSVRVPISNTYVQHRPQLFRNGQLMKYREDIEKLLETSETEPNSLRRDSVVLSPNDATAVGVIDLANWYKPLKLRHYQLTIKHRFELGGTWIESSSVTFDVDSKEE